MKCGGTSDVKEATQEIMKLCDEIKEELEKKADKTYPVYKPLTYTSQLVAGTNYFVKICVSEDGRDYIHVRIFTPLPHTGEKSQVHSVQKGKAKDDDLAYF